MQIKFGGVILVFSPAHLRVELARFLFKLSLKIAGRHPNPDADGIIWSATEWEATSKDILIRLKRTEFNRWGWTALKIITDESVEGRIFAPMLGQFGYVDRSEAADAGLDWVRAWQRDNNLE